MEPLGGLRTSEWSGVGGFLSRPHGPGGTRRGRRGNRICDHRRCSCSGLICRRDHPRPHTHWTSPKWPSNGWRRDGRSSSTRGLWPHRGRARCTIQAAAFSPHQQRALTRPEQAAAAPSLALRWHWCQPAPPSCRRQGSRASRSRRHVESNRLGGGYGLACPSRE